MACGSLHAHDKPCGAGFSTPTRALVASQLPGHAARGLDGTTTVAYEVPITMNVAP